MGGSFGGKSSTPSLPHHPSTPSPPSPCTTKQQAPPLSLTKSKSLSHHQTRYRSCELIACSSTQHNGRSTLPTPQINLHHPNILPWLLPLPLRSGSPLSVPHVHPLVPPRCLLLERRENYTKRIIVHNQKLYFVLFVQTTCKSPPVFSCCRILHLQQATLSQTVLPP